MNAVTVTSWEDLQQHLFADSWNPKIKRFRSRHAFRGMSDASRDLKTGLIRLGGDFVTMEKHLLRNFKKYAHQSVVEKDSVWHWLSVAQHHGLPTRLLDWTYSPFAALHFATAGHRSFDIDGAVWKVDYGAAHEQLPASLWSILDREGSAVFTVEMLAESIDSLQKLDGLTNPASTFAIFFEPPSIDERIVNQFAYFSVISDPAMRMDMWLAKHPHVWKKIIIPKELKWEIRDKLDQSNVTERVLFPGLDGLCKWLSRHYTPRP